MYTYIYNIYIYVRPAPVVHRRGPSRAVHGLPTVQPSHSYRNHLDTYMHIYIRCSFKALYKPTHAAAYRILYMETRSCNRPPCNKPILIYIYTYINIYIIYIYIYTCL